MIQKLFQRTVLALALTTLSLTGLSSPVLAEPQRAAGGSFDTSRYPAQRHEVDALRTKGLPHLSRNYEVLRPGTSTFNCIAWSLGVTRKWLWPGNSIRAFDQLNAQFGYHKLSQMDFRLQPGVAKVVLYAKTVNGHLVPTHQARQGADGTWTSKLGKLAVIRHATPNALDGPDYGRPVAVYARKL